MSPHSQRLSPLNSAPNSEQLNLPSGSLPFPAPNATRPCSALPISSVATGAPSASPILSVASPGRNSSRRSSANFSHTLTHRKLSRSPPPFTAHSPRRPESLTFSAGGGKAGGGTCVVKLRPRATPPQRSAPTQCSYSIPPIRLSGQYRNTARPTTFFAGNGPNERLSMLLAELSPTVK